MKKKTTQKKRIVLLDTHAILHRAYHALPDFTASDGSPTGALYGLVTMLLKLADDLSPNYIVSCFDLPGPTYRHHAFEGYKAKREKMEDALSSQIKKSRDILHAFGIPIYDAVGFEADDILGTIVDQMKDNDEYEIVIASGDMDTLQLVKDGKVMVYTLKKGIKETILYNEEEVVHRFGFLPTLLPDYKGLRGDPSDNIPGIVGIGEKTATTLITTFGGLEAIYKKIEKNPGLFKEAGLSDRIIEKLKDNKEEAGFSKELATIRRDAPITFSLPKKEWKDGVSIKEISALFELHSFRTLTQRVKAIFGDEKVAQDGKTKEGEGSEHTPIDEEILEKAKIALWLVDSERTNPSLDEILEHTGKKTLEEAIKYLIGELKKEELVAVYENIELPLIPVIHKMKERGVCINTAYLKELSKEYHTTLTSIEKKIHALAGEDFNINSPKQLGHILFDVLNIEVKGVKKTATGQRSTKESELIKLKNTHPIIGEILLHRELQKLLSTYIDTLPLLVGTDGRLHPDFLQAGTTTGRMASQNPNMQNLPIRSEQGKNIRNAVVAPNGFSIVSLDYSQIELRIAAFLSGDEKLIQIFLRGGDVHTEVAAEMFGVPPEQVDKEMRRRAKVINFGILYGMGVTALTQALGTTRSEAQAFYNDYFKSFSGITRYLASTKEGALREGYTKTLFGRKRRFPGMRSPLPYVVAQAERMAINAPIQGTQSDIIKIAMRTIVDEIEKRKWDKKAYLILQVHDELVFEIENALVPEASKVFAHIMESVLPKTDTCGITLAVEGEVGPTWGEMKEITTS